MSFSLPVLDTTGFTTATTGTIDLKNTGVSAGGISANPATLDNPAHIYLFNDSGVGFQMVFKESGKGFDVPAGAWFPVSVLPGNTILQYSVLYALNNPPVNKLMMTYYAPGEPLPKVMNLGNSPIGGSLLPVQASTLSNETSTAGALVIDMGDPTFANLINIYNDGHGTWFVDRSGVKHQVILISATSGNPLQLGQSGDIVEVLGFMTVDQTLVLASGNVDVKVSHVISNGGYYNYDNTSVARIMAYINSATNDNTLVTSFANGILHIINSAQASDIATFTDTGLATKLFGTLNVIGATKLDNSTITTNGTGDMFFNNNSHIQMQDHLLANHVVLGTDTSDNVNLQEISTTGKINFRDANAALLGSWGIAGTGGLTITVGDLILTNKKIADPSRNLIDWSSAGGGCFFKGGEGGIAQFFYQANGSNTDWSRAAETHGTGTTANGAVVVTHSLKFGNVAATPDQVLITPSGSAAAAWWVDTLTTTQFTIHSTTVFTFSWTAVKY